QWRKTRQDPPQPTFGAAPLEVERELPDGSWVKRLRFHGGAEYVEQSRVGGEFAWQNRTCDGTSRATKNTWDYDPKTETFERGPNLPDEAVCPTIIPDGARRTKMFGGAVIREEDDAVSWRSIVHTLDPRIEGRMTTGDQTEGWIRTGPGPDSAQG